MRPTTPKYNFAAQADPSSPPETPTSPQFMFQYRQYKTRRNGMVFTPATIPITPTNPINIPREQPRTASPFYTNHTELSPRTSSPASSVDSSTISTSFPAPRSLSSSPNEHVASSPPTRNRARTISLLKANFTVEELRESEYEEWDSDDGSIIRPSQYEDVESERGSIKNGTPARTSNGTTYTHEPTTTTHGLSPASHKYSSPRRTTPQKPIDPRVTYGLGGLHFGNSDTEEEDSDDDGGYAEHQAWVELQRAERRRIRRSSSSFKRNFTQSLGSGSDTEDIVPQGPLDANDPGSSARRLRRRTQDGRTSLVFDDPPPRIDEMEEPESCEEVVEMGEDEVREGLAKEFPYWVQQGMDLDETSSEDDSDETNSDDD